MMVSFDRFLKLIMVGFWRSFKVSARPASMAGGAVVDLTEDGEDEIAGAASIGGSRRRMERQQSLVYLDEADEKFSPGNHFEGGRSPATLGKRKGNARAGEKDICSENIVCIDCGNTPPHRASSAGPSRVKDESSSRLHKVALTDDARPVGSSKVAVKLALLEHGPSGRGGGGGGGNAQGNSSARQSKNHSPGKTGGPGGGVAQVDIAKERDGRVGHSRDSRALDIGFSSSRRSRPGRLVTCGSCGSSEGYTILAQCGCHICRDCMASRIFSPLSEARDSKCSSKDSSQLFPRTKPRGCDECGTDYTERDMLFFFPKGDVERVQLQVTLSFLDSDPNVVQCPGPGCGSRIMRITETKDGGRVDRVAPDGQALTAKAAKHMATYRLRCPDCSANFCSSCMAIPYHTTLSCAEHKQRQAAQPCRFCSAPLPPKAKSGAVCGSAECKEALSAVCDVRHQKCLHWCLGVFGEVVCPPCIECSGGADEFCNICWTEALRASPVIYLSCKHVFHIKCVRERLTKRWPTTKISFNFAKCPLCRVWVDHSEVSGQMREVKALMATVQGAAVTRLKLEGGDKDKAALAKHGGNVTDLAMSRYNYYLCKKCNRPYFGGMAACGDAVGNDNEDAGNRVEELMCGKCSGEALGMGSKMDCKEHGDQYVEFKCRFCCDIATFFCFGHTHFCDACHKKWGAGAFQSPAKLVKPCKCNVTHVPNGTTPASEACFGCSLCRIKVKEHAPI